MQKLLNGIIEVLHYKNTDATFEDIADTLWLYSVMNKKSSTKTNKQEQNANKQNTQKPPIKDSASSIEHNIKTTQQEQKQNNKSLKVTQSNQQDSTTSASVPKGEYKNIPTHKQFDKFNQFAKSLKVLKKLTSSDIQVVVDIDKTVDYIANTDIWNIIFKPKMILFYNLTLLIEVSQSMEIYNEIIKELTKSFKRFSIFNKITIYYLKEDSNCFQIYKDKNCKTEVKKLYATPNKDFAFIVTDYISKGWSDKRGYSFLKNLYKDFSLSILNLLPKRYWRRTYLKKYKSVIFTHKKTFLNNSLIHNNIDTSSVLKVPMLNLEPNIFKEWSNLNIYKKDNWLSGYIFEANLFNKEIKNINPHHKPQSNPEKIVNNFNKYSSPLARKLAIYLSVVPLSLDIMKIVLKENLKEANYTHLAEVFLGGLLKKSNYKTKDGKIIYEFIDGIQDILYKKLLLHKKVEILSHNSSFISNNLGSFIDFQALVENPNLQTGIALKDNDKLFAKILIKVFKELGKEYELVATNLEESLKDIKISKETEDKIANVVKLTSNSFKMGSEDGDNDEKPVHTVTFDYNFEIAKYPVTFEEYDLFCEDTGKKKPDDRGWGRGKRPVINVSWDDASEYCDWLNEKLGISKDSPYGYRLPTEAEWEYACRAGTTTKWSFGDKEEELDKYAWYDKNSNGKTHIVGEKLPNPWGLFDMHGNVWEWCEDNWTDNYNNTPRDGSAYKSKNKNSSKVVRGGSCFNYAYRSRSAYRVSRYRNIRFNIVGFRLLRTLP